MTCSSCAQRRNAMVRIVKSASVGKTETVISDLRFILDSSVHDASAALRQKTAAARQRLTMRR